MYGVDIILVSIIPMPSSWEKIYTGLFILYFNATLFGVTFVEAIEITIIPRGAI